MKDKFPIMLRKILKLSFLTFLSFQAEATSSKEKDDVVIAGQRFPINTTTKICYFRLQHIPAAIGRLKNLTYLDLFNTKLTGEIPKEIGDLKELSCLNLSNNQLTGEIPKEIGKLENLMYFEAHHNQLTGKIPEEISKLENLMYFKAHHNQLTGEIPVIIGNLSNLERLDLSHNQLTGEIPAIIGNLSNLEHLNLSHNQLTGAIPVTIGNLTNLARIYLCENQLTGFYPNLFNIPKSLVLVLSDNHLNFVETPAVPICVQEREVIIGVGGPSFNPRIFSFFEKRALDDSHGTINFPVKFHLSDVKGTPVEALEDCMIWFEEGQIKGKHYSTWAMLPDTALPPELQKAVDFIQTEKNFHGGNRKNPRTHLREEPEPTDTFDEIDSLKKLRINKG